MTDSTDSRPTVLIVDDEQGLVDVYAAFLADDYTVRTAYGGEEALDQSNEDVDVVLLDRRMPTISGDEVLSTIRNCESDCQVVMVTAVYPDFDVLDMGFGGCLTKPVDSGELHSVVEQLLTRRGYDEQIQNYYQLIAKRAVLAAEKSENELNANDEFTALKQRIGELGAKVDTAIGEFDVSDFGASFRKLDSS
ncbi:HalX domain-containing protein [Haloplanus salilacus]|uniref:HalX domain-containing protein n=1 Tax=Haloplanus salilacus TaxID=2949994 RepID=UPI0030CB752E